VGLDCAVITDEIIEPAVAPEHPLRHRKTLTLPELCGQTLIALPEGTGLRSRLDEACAAQGLRPRIGFEATNPLELADLARRGLGVAILPRSMARGDAGLHALRLTPTLRGRLVWAWRREAAGPAAHAFCALALRRLRPAGRG